MDVKFIKSIELITKGKLTIIKRFQCWLFEALAFLQQEALHSL